MKKWYYLEQRGSDKKVGLCFNNCVIEYVTCYDAELGRRVYGDLEAWDEEERLYAPWYYVLKKQPTLAEIRGGLKSGAFSVC